MAADMFALFGSKITDQKSYIYMELSQIIPHIEALIFASDKPLTGAELVELVNNALGFIEDRATPDQIDASVEGIKEKYSAEFYAFELREIGGGYQFLTKKEYHKTVAQLNGDKFLKRLSIAALETLAIIAYKQPITKSEIESIRGVNCDYAVQKLLEKDLVVISGRNEDAVGKPLIYSTSRSFMDYFGINSAEELPKISEVLMEELVSATNVQEAIDERTAFEDNGATTTSAAEEADVEKITEIENKIEEITATESVEDVENEYDTDIGTEVKNETEEEIVENTDLENNDKETIAD